MPYNDPRIPRPIEEILAESKEKPVETPKKKPPVKRMVKERKVIAENIDLKYKALTEKRYYQLYLKGLRDFLKKEGAQGLTVLNYIKLGREIEAIKKHIKTL